MTRPAQSPLSSIFVAANDSRPYWDDTLGVLDWSEKASDDRFAARFPGTCCPAPPSSARWGSRNLRPHDRNGLLWRGPISTGQLNAAFGATREQALKVELTCAPSSFLGWESKGTGRSGEAERRIINTHIHVPPNFSAFETAEDAVETAAAEGVRVLGASNLHDPRIYSRFADAARAAGIIPPFGLEFISVVVLESRVSFGDTYCVILGLGGIPCYPIRVDVASPVCPWEEPPARLAERLLASVIYAAELIPGRNLPEVVNAYVAAFRDSGIIVMAGTEHKTRRRIPLEPRCADGSLPSPAAREAIWQVTCVAAAHQHLRASGQQGYADGRGRLNPSFPEGESRIRWFVELGAELTNAASLAAAQ